VGVPIIGTWRESLEEICVDRRDVRRSFTLGAASLPTDMLEKATKVAKGGIYCLFQQNWWMTRADGGLCLEALNRRSDVVSWALKGYYVKLELETEKVSL
jgi:hypothetical protein